MLVLLDFSVCIHVERDEATRRPDLLIGLIELVRVSTHCNDTSMSATVQHSKSYGFDWRVHTLVALYELHMKARPIPVASSICPSKDGWP